jgi:hypothetical protein
MMAQLSLGEVRWRMVRRALKKKRFRFEDCRNQRRQDLRDFEWLVENGIFSAVADGLYEMTDKGRAAADLGFYEWEPVRPPTPPAKRRRK